MIIGKALYALLSANSTVSTLTGNRIVPLLMENAASAVPFIVYSAEDANTSDPLNCTATLMEQAVSIACFAASYADAATLATAVTDTLDDYTGTAGGVEVLGIFYEGERETKGGFDDSPDLLFNVKEVDFKVCWRRP